MLLIAYFSAERRQTPSFVYTRLVVENCIGGLTGFFHSFLLRQLEIDWLGVSEGFQSDILVESCGILPELIVVLRACQEVTLLSDLATRVVGVFNFEVDNCGLVHGHILTELHLAHSHEHVESCVRFVLAIANASLFAGRFCGEIFRVDTVEVTASEEERGQGVRLEFLFAIVGVGLPVLVR